MNDWATAEIVKQYAKNKRKNHYGNGWLEVPQKYAYLKQNASKRNQTASRKKRASSGVGGASWTSQSHTTITRNGKRKRVIQDEDEDEQSSEQVGSVEEDG